MSCGVYRPRSFAVSPVDDRPLGAALAGRRAGLGAGLAGAFFAGVLDARVAAVAFFFAAFFMRRTVHNARESVNAIAARALGRLAPRRIPRAYPDGLGSAGFVTS
jgi:hypothetical protein